jgi:tRNA(Ile)-lysidine synthase
VARKRKIHTVALAHHADDQVELFFLRLLSGSGGGGLAGMKWHSPSPVDKKISLVRPLLDVSKAELERYACEKKIWYREDDTNSSPDFLRNRIRHELLPLLRKHYQPALNKAVLRLMDIVGAESDFLEEIARSWFRRVGREFEKLPLAIQRQVLKVQLTELGIAADFELIETLRKSANQPISVFANFSVSRNASGHVVLSEHRTQTFDEGTAIVDAEKAGRTVFSGVKLQWKPNPQPKPRRPFRAPPVRPGTELFDAGQTGRRIILRHWRAGDRFQPIGFKSPVKLQDLFTNQKIPRAQRHKLIVAEAAGEIFWVEGLRISENFKLTPQTKRQLVWRWRR